MEWEREGGGGATLLVPCVYRDVVLALTLPSYARASAAVISWGEYYLLALCIDDYHGEIFEDGEVRVRRRNIGCFIIPIS